MRFLLKLKKYQRILSHLGFSWCVGRLVYFFKLKLKFAKWQTPQVTLNDQFFNSITQGNRFETNESYFLYRSDNRRKFFFHPNDFEQWKSQLNGWDSASNSPVKAADKVLNGEICYFQCIYKSIGFPPRWAENPFTGDISKISKHWSEISDFEQGDIKVLWEPSRFSFVFLLIRAFARTGHEKYANAFWEAFEDWCIENPTNSGIHWKCGQEITFRVMAWCFGLNAFLQSKRTTPDRVANLVSMLFIHGQRIEKNIGYGLSQNNNHGISEAVGLWTIGILFPEMRNAHRWKELGRKWITRQVDALIYEDGSFSQHSINYHRLMLHDLLWAIRLGQINNDSLPKSVISKTILAGKWLEYMIVGTNGEAPNYGSNDGALLFPLSNCDYQDFRPVVQAIARLDPNNDAPFPPEPWDEESLWFYGLGCLEKEHIEKKKNREFSAEEGGYFKFTNTDSSLFVRCPKTFRHRPGQADLLHVDLWWKGENIALDPGTYSYNQAPPWDNGLTRTSVHNTVTVDGMDQSDRYGRFLMLPWPKGRVNRKLHSVDRNIFYWEGEQDGYQRLKPSAIHRRGIIRLPNDCWAFLDTVSSKKNYPWEVHWLFPDVPYQITEISDKSKQMKLEMQNGTYSACFLSLSSKLNSDVVRADKKSVRGWRSRYYSTKEPAISLKISIPTSNSVFVTVFGPLHQEISIDEDGCQLGNTNFTAYLRLSKNIIESGPLVESIFVKTINGNKITNLAIR